MGSQQRMAGSQDATASVSVTERAIEPYLLRIFSCISTIGASGRICQDECIVFWTYLSRRILSLYGSKRSICRSGSLVCGTGRPYASAVAQSDEWARGVCLLFR